MNKPIHTKVAATLQQVVESVMLSDWRSVTKERILQDVARLRTVKAQYISTHLTHQLEIREALLSPLDQALLALYLLLDTLEGRDLAMQRGIYYALLEAQTPLLLACAIIPLETAEGQEGDDPSVLHQESMAESAIQEALQEPDLMVSSQTEISSSDEKEAPSSKWFRWNEERELQLNEA
jgi:hypothetical protein